MAYAFIVNFEQGGTAEIPGQPLRAPDGSLIYTIRETDVDAADEWSIEHVPKTGTITLYESQLVTGGAASTIDPEIGIAGGFSLDTLQALPPNATASVNIRNGDDSRYASPKGILVGRSTPDVDPATEIHTRITIRPRH